MHCNRPCKGWWQGGDMPLMARHCRTIALLRQWHFDQQPNQPMNVAHRWPMGSQRCLGMLHNKAEGYHHSTPATLLACPRNPTAYQPPPIHFLLITRRRPHTPHMPLADAPADGLKDFATTLNGQSLEVVWHHGNAVECLPRCPFRGRGLFAVQLSAHEGNNALCLLGRYMGCDPVM